MFAKTKEMVLSLAKEKSFEEACDLLQSFVFSFNTSQLKSVVIPIGIIPEIIEHDSTEEKLFAKVADIVLAKCFQELGLSSSVIKARSNCADVIAKSNYHNYSLVGDAKAFRLSRTAKNQKDFKVQSIVHWKGDCNYAVLVCPFFQYPRSHSQIYRHALQGNVFLFSWEHLFFLLDNNIKETNELSLEPIWNISFEIAKLFSLADKNIIYWDKQDKLMCDYIHCSSSQLLKTFSEIKGNIIEIGKLEIQYYQKLLAKFASFTREQAIEELIKHHKLHEKINTIHSFLKFLA